MKLFTILLFFMIGLGLTVPRTIFASEMKMDDKATMDDKGVKNADEESIKKDNDKSVMKSDDEGILKDEMGNKDNEKGEDME